MSLLSLLLAANVQTGIKITVTTRGDTGAVHCALYSSGEAWLGSKATAGTTAKISRSRAVCQFKNLPEGIYAISIFHDENGNGELDTNFLGIPSEGVAASRNATGTFGPPKFDDAKFKHDGVRTALQAKLVY